jgi:NAD(P)-dependent dehydrogenase (short-subunit alcohol dehydrogenase family)
MGFLSAGTETEVGHDFDRRLGVCDRRHRITANAICAGVTDTPAVRKIPGHERLLEAARMRNPHGRLTTPDDVATALVELTEPGCGWITGNVIRVDGGEGIAG